MLLFLSPFTGSFQNWYDIVVINVEGDKKRQGAHSIPGFCIYRFSQLWTETAGLSTVMFWYCGARQAEIVQFLWIMNNLFLHCSWFFGFVWIGCVTLPSSVGCYRIQINLKQCIVHNIKYLISFSCLKWGSTIGHVSSSITILKSVLPYCGGKKRNVVNSVYLLIKSYSLHYLNCESKSWSKVFTS